MGATLPSRSSRSLLPWLLCAGLLAVAAGAAVAGALSPHTSVARSPGPRLPRLSSTVVTPPTIDGSPPVSGQLRAPGGPFLYDDNGRVVFLHGVNVVYKHPPFEVYPDRGKPWNFDASDASLIARLGFNVVRLGMTWRGLEPGTVPANDPAICREGRPGNPHQFNQAVLNRYLRRLAQTVDLLGHFHIYTILDMHQDVYNEKFDGEGAPDWAVCTDGLASVDPPGRWSHEYATAAAGTAFHHFWTNDVVGNLQGQYDMVWGDVARYFRHNPWVLGFDPFNEPFSKSHLVFGDEHLDGQLECFYTGRANIGRGLHGAPPIGCPKDDPAQGVIPTISANDPGQLIFDEPDNFANRGYPADLGPMDMKNLVFNVHVYCGARNPITGNPTDSTACAAQDARSLRHKAEDRSEMASPAQRGGPAWFVSEFGATSNPTLVRRVTADADEMLVGWAYWSWRFYDDPTGSSAEALVMANGKLRSTAFMLSQTYPEAIAGKPISMSFTPQSARFHLVYRPRRSVRAPTVIFIPAAMHYRHGYCPRVSGASVTSIPGAVLLEVANAARGGLVRVTVTRGACR